jgi:hypothetical protein
MWIGKEVTESIQDLFDVICGFEQIREDDIMN